MTSVSTRCDLKMSIKYHILVYYIEKLLIK